MKRIAFVLVTILILTTMLFLTACGQYEAAADDDAPLRVVATIFPQYDFVRQIAGDRVELTMLLSPGAESHGFQPTPRDIITINTADLLVYVGGHGDEWMGPILASLGREDMTVVALLDLVDAVMTDHHHDHDDHHDHHDDNECDRDDGG